MPVTTEASAIGDAARRPAAAAGRRARSLRRGELAHAVGVRLRRLVAGHRRPARVGAVAELGARAARVRWGVPLLAVVGPGGRPVRRGRLRLRDVDDVGDRARDRGAARHRRGDLPRGTRAAPKSPATGSHVCVERNCKPNFCRGRTEFRHSSHARRPVSASTRKPKENAIAWATASPRRRLEAKACSRPGLRRAAEADCLGVHRHGDLRFTAQPV